jgi:hypothetical protein
MFSYDKFVSLGRVPGAAGPGTKEKLSENRQKINDLFLKMIFFYIVVFGIV